MNLKNNMASSLYDETKSTILTILKNIKNNEILDFSNVVFLNPIGYCLIKNYAKDRKIDIISRNKEKFNILDKLFE